MALQTSVAAINPGDTTFRFVVPGQYRWNVLSVYAVATTDIGGQPDRAYLLTITDSTNIVAQIAAVDAGTEPATVDVTFADVPGAAVTAGVLGITQAPIPPLALNPGYVIQGDIVNPVGVDTWVSAVAFYDQAST